MNLVESMNTYLTTAFPMSKPQWATKNELVLKTKAFNLRRFGKKIGVSTLVIPPQAGHSSHIADYDKNQSIVETIVDNRNGPVYCIEWLPATQDRKYETIADLVYQVDTACEFIGESPHIVGLCQGGWLASLYSSIFRDNVLTLTCIAAPIDFHKGGGAIFDTVTRLGMGPYRFFVDVNSGIMSGFNMLTGWKMMNAVDRYVIDYIKILNILDDKEKIRKTKKFRTWYEYTQDLAGAWFLEAVEQLFLNNKLIKKQLVINGDVVDLRNINCPTYMIAGGKDDITLTSHLFPLGDYVSSKRIYKSVIPKAGHVGCFMGTDSQKFIKTSVEELNKLT